MNELNRKEIDDVQVIIRQLLPLIDQAEDQFRSARNWGILDILGGGTLVDIIKHTKLNKASNCMNQINYLLHDLQRELKDVTIPTDFQMNTASFATLADFMFDGILADVYMQSKIVSSMEQVQELRRRLLILQDRLNQLAARC
ncbi:MAG: hypothetical protein KBT02_07930 [Treponema sp.]|nr:hypothetical protein [Candidatus Treponema caballi]